jgi:hypothetical protein
MISSGVATTKKISEEFRSGSVSAIFNSDAVGWVENESAVSLHV